MKNKNQKENWEKEFDKKFSLSDFWLNPNNYPKNYRDIIAFIKEERKIVENNTLKHIEEDYQKFIKEIRQEEKEELLEKIKLDEKLAKFYGDQKKSNDWWYGYNQATEDLEKLKSQLKDGK